MERTSLFSLLILAPASAICLALLGLETLRHNPTGWILLCLGIACSSGIVIDYHARHGTHLSLAAGGGKANERGNLSFWLLLPGFLVLFFAPPLEWLYGAPWLPRTTAWEAVGAASFLVGMALVVWARIALGRSRSKRLGLADRQPFVDAGPYHVVRYPALAGMFLMGLGVAIGYSSAIGLAAGLILVLPALAYRLHVEDRLLAALHGDVYAAYARRTWRIIPGLW